MLINSNENTSTATAMNTPAYVLLTFTEIASFFQINWPY